MGWLYQHAVKPALFRLDPEQAHELGVAALAGLGRLRPLCALLEQWNQLPPARYRPVECLGLKFPNAVGLAAGFDKNGEAWTAAAALGFGHVEIGTVTLHAQPGNPRPRAFRYPADEAVINRMGFNNAGAAALAARLSKGAAPGRRKIPLGINLGKSKVTSLDRATEDYLGSFRLLADHADYVAVNVSSPNTPGPARTPGCGLAQAAAGRPGRREQGPGHGGTAAPAHPPQDRPRSDLSADRRGPRGDRRAQARRHHCHEHHAGPAGPPRGGRSRRGD